jgi:hypothetical protein
LVDELYEQLGYNYFIDYDTHPPSPQHKMVALAKLSEGIAADHHIGNHIPITLRKIRIIFEDFLQHLTPLV